MDPFQFLKIFSLPTWAKVVIVTILLALGLVNAYFFFSGLYNPHRDSWVPPSITLLGVLLPFLIGTIIVSFGNSGISSLQTKTESLFTDLLPTILKNIPESTGKFYNPDQTDDLPASHQTAKIFINLLKGTCYSDILVYTPWHGAMVEVVLRLEVNVKKVNSVIIFERDLVLAAFKKVQPEADGNDNEILSKWLFAKFGHTAGGAKMKIASDDGHGHQSTFSGYEFNPNIVTCEKFGRMSMGLVASCSVPPDFLYDASERLFFAQDFMFFIRSYISEGIELLHKIDGDVDAYVAKTYGIIAVS